MNNNDWYRKQWKLLAFHLLNYTLQCVILACVCLMHVKLGMFLMGMSIWYMVTTMHHTFSQIVKIVCGLYVGPPIALQQRLQLRKALY